MSNKRLKVLHITRNLPPLVGGMELLNLRIIENLSRRCESYCVVGPKDAKSVISANRISFYASPLKPLFLFLISASWNSIKAAHKIKPDIVLAGSGLTAPIAVITAKVFGKRSAVYLHGLDIAHTGAIYSYFWLPFIRKSDIVIANSRSTQTTAIGRGVATHKLTIIPPGVDNPQADDPSSQYDLTTKYNLQNKKILISIGRLTERKGLREFILNSLPNILKDHPDTILLIIGSPPKNSLHAQEQSEESLIQAAKTNGIQDKIVFTGEISDRATISAALRCSSVHVFPVKEIAGDPEGFGMVAIEAAAHGVPTVAFRTGGTEESVKHGESGILIGNMNYQSFGSSVSSLLKDATYLTESCRHHAENFRWKVVTSSLYKALT